MLEYFERRVQGIMQSEPMLQGRSVMVWADARALSPSMASCCAPPAQTIVETTGDSTAGSMGAMAGKGRPSSSLPLPSPSLSVGDAARRGYRIVVGSRSSGGGGVDVGSEAGAPDETKGTGLSVGRSGQTWKGVYNTDLLRDSGGNFQAATEQLS